MQDKDKPILLAREQLAHLVKAELVNYSINI
jgi:hypothetical protein